MYACASAPERLHKKTVKSKYNLRKTAIEFDELSIEWTIVE